MRRAALLCGSAVTAATWSLVPRLPRFALSASILRHSSKCVRKITKLRQELIAQGLDPDDEVIFAAFFDDATFTDGTYNLPVEARWSTIINTPAPQLNVALDTALHSLATSSKQLKGCFVEGTFTTRNLAPNDIKKIVDEVNKISHMEVGS